MKKVYYWLAGLQLFVGIGAMAGGSAAILDPQAPLGIPVEIMKNASFSNYLIPGILLFAVIGVGSVASAWSILCKFRYRAYISNVFSWALVIWIIVQCFILWNIHPLHIIFFSIGIIEAALSMIVLFREQWFPTNLVMGVYKRINKEM